MKLDVSDSAKVSRLIAKWFKIEEPPTDNFHEHLHAF
jgi:hypothetical protein